MGLGAKSTKGQRRRQRRRIFSGCAIAYEKRKLIDGHTNAKSICLLARPPSPITGLRSATSTAPGVVIGILARKSYRMG